MKDGSSGCPFHPGEPTRRSLLVGLGLAGGGVLAATVPSRANEPLNNPADAPTAGGLQQRNAFYGRHQAGIITPRPATGMVAAFDVLARTPAGLERLMRLLTERIAFLMLGGRPPQIDPKFPPPDSGILGPSVPPDNLTITVSVGASLFDERFGLANLKPRHLQRMTSFRNDALDPEECHGDLLVQICSNTADTNIHALRDLVKTTPEFLTLRWKQEGSVPVLPPRPGQPNESARNLLGFKDGTANPDAGDSQAMDRLVWIQPGAAEPAWATGGSYQVVRLIRQLVERWDRTPLAEQEEIIGRRKESGSPFDGRVEHDAPNFRADPEGKLTPLDAHIRLANPRDPGSERNLILRRPFNYSRGLTKAGQLDMGLMFICYQANLQDGFITVQKRLDGEPLEEYIKPIGGGFFYVLPGVSQGGFLGEGLFQSV